jgi:hypothetical protein
LTQRFDALAGMREVARLTYPEFSTHFAGQTASLLEWQTYELSDEAVILELTLVACAGDEIAGFATALRGPEDGTASHRTLAVAPAWRRAASPPRSCAPGGPQRPTSASSD